jgi:DNA-binding CsgD family transcriptional regulator
MAAAAAAYVARGHVVGDPIARRLATARSGFTLERYFARPVDRVAGGTLADHVANLRAHGLRHVAVAPVPCGAAARRYVLAVAGASDEDPDRFAARFAQTEWLLTLAATALCARIEDGAVARPSHVLSASEARVAACLAQDMRPAEIAHALGKSERTVRNQIESARTRLGVRTNSGLVAAAIRLRLIRT